MCECVQPKRMNCGVKHESGKKRHKKKIERNAASIRGKKKKNKIARVWVAHLERWGYNWRPTSHRVLRTQMYGSGYTQYSTHMDSKNNHSCIRHCMYWDKWVSEWVVIVIVMQSSRHRKRVHRRHGGRCFVVFPNNNKHIDRKKTVAASPTYVVQRVYITHKHAATAWFVAADAHAEAGEQLVRFILVLLSYLLFKYAYGRSIFWSVSVYRSTIAPFFNLTQWRVFKTIKIVK